MPGIPLWGWLLLALAAPPGNEPAPGGAETTLPPGLLREPGAAPPLRPAAKEARPFVEPSLFSPPGFTGPSSIAPSVEPPPQWESLSNDDRYKLGLPPNLDPRFLPIEDRWRIGLPQSDRYGRGNRNLDDYPQVEGNFWDPYNLHVLKGDFPIAGNHLFLNITASSLTTVEGRSLPSATTPFESTRNAGQRENFGNGTQFFYNNDFRLTFELFHGQAAFKPVDWQIRLTPVFNVNVLDVQELAQVDPDVRRGTTRDRTFATLEEWFIETKLSDLSDQYDFVSVRLGSQFFVSDFRGFIFSDTNRAIRIFGNRFSNRDQFNVALFSQQEKDTNSGLNTFNDRRQLVFIANYFRQDFIFPGYTIEGSVHYNHDEASFKFDRNHRLVRPDGAGVFTPHQIDVAYLGLTGDGHIGRINVNNAFYWALGRDQLNPLAGQAVDINGKMAALELSYDRDWARFRTSLFYSSGDGNIGNGHATGFDSILDNPQFAGGQFSFFQRQQIGLLGVNSVTRNSLIPDLRSSKIQGQANFVNPGLNLINVGFDAELTPKLRSINNVNWLWFDKTNVLEQFIYQGGVSRWIGVDLSTGVEYRPLLSNNVIITAGVASLIQGTGFRDIYNHKDSRVNPLFSGFMQMILAF